MLNSFPNAFEQKLSVGCRIKIFVKIRCIIQNIHIHFFSGRPLDERQKSF